MGRGVSVRGVSMGSGARLLDLVSRVPILPATFLDRCIYRLCCALGSTLVAIGSVGLRRGPVSRDGRGRRSFATSRRSPCCCRALLSRDMRSKVPFSSFSGRVSSTRINAVYPKSPLHRGGSRKVNLIAVFAHTTVRKKVSFRGTCAYDSCCVRSVRTTDGVARIVRLVRAVCFSVAGRMRRTALSTVGGPVVHRYVACLSARCERGVGLRRLTGALKCAGCCLSAYFGGRANISVSRCVVRGQVTCTGLVLGGPSVSVRRVDSRLYFTGPDRFSTMFGGVAKLAPARCQGRWSFGPCWV